VLGLAVALVTLAAQVDAVPAVPIMERPMPYTPSPLFDGRVSPRSGFLVAGVASVPPSPWNGREHALSLAVGDGLRTEWGVAFLELERSIRVTAPRLSDLSVRLPCYALSGGLHLGPFELEAGGGLSLLGVDWLDDDGVGFSFLSPGASARATLVIDRVRASVQVSTEYLWRWFDRRDVVLNALALQIAISSPPSMKFGTRPLDVQN
jgi:hypothetical protein